VVKIVGWVGGPRSTRHLMRVESVCVSWPASLQGGLNMVETDATTNFGTSAILFDYFSPSPSLFVYAR
jgi:hypothetical protein